jgi:CRP/FNR family cyclic AMP-dependent transcriptional regulator
MDAEDQGAGTEGTSHLRAVPWFAACTAEQLTEVARIAEHLRVQAGEVIVREGRLGRELFVILEGTATVTRDDRVVNVLSGGDYFGEMAAIEAKPRSATVTATTDLDVLIIGPREFETMMDIPGFRNALLTGIREADDRLAAYAARYPDFDPRAGGPPPAS